MNMNVTFSVNFHFFDFSLRILTFGLNVRETNFMSVNSQSGPAKPKTAKEARKLMNLAIERGEFEDAKLLAEEISSLENFETELELAKTVYGYYGEKQLFSDNMDRNCKGYEQQISEARKNSQDYFSQEFFKLKEQLEQELDALLEKWDNARVVAQGDAEVEFQQTMTTAKLLASRMRFDEAIKIKNEAEAKLRVRAKNSTRKVDLKFDKQCNLLLDRQLNTIKALAERRNAEMKLFDALLDAAQSQALEMFLQNNANAVIQIAARFSPDASIPKSLQMQTIRGRPMTPKGKTDWQTPERKFMKKMIEVDKTIGYPIKAPLGRLPPSGALPTRTGGSSNEVTELSDLSLTRSPFKSPIAQ